MFAFALASSTCSEAASAKIRCLEFSVYRNTRACLKNHSCNLHAPICGIFCLHSVDVARYAALIQAKSPTNCNAHLAESIFQTPSRAFFKHALILAFSSSQIHTYHLREKLQNLLQQECKQDSPEKQVPRVQSARYHS